MRMWNSFSCSVSGVAVRIWDLKLRSVCMRAVFRLKSGERAISGSRFVFEQGTTIPILANPRDSVIPSVLDDA